MEKSIDDMSAEEVGKVVARRAMYEESQGREEMTIGSRVKDFDGVEGTIVDIDGELARVEWDNGDKSEIHTSRLRPANGWE